MGTDLFSACDSSCISANESNMGGLFLAALIVGNVVLVGLRLNRQHAALKGLKIVLGVSAVLAFFVMMNRRTFCTYCALAQVSWFLLAIDSLFSFHRTLALLALAIPIGWIASSIWPVVGHGNAPPVIFELRDYDRIDRSLPYAMVIFGDPLCPHCRAAEAAMLKKAPPVPFFTDGNFYLKMARSLFGLPPPSRVQCAAMLPKGSSGSAKSSLRRIQQRQTQC
jgi:hypothetical protein